MKKGFTGGRLISDCDSFSVLYEALKGNRTSAIFSSA